MSVHGGLGNVCAITEDATMRCLDEVRPPVGLGPFTDVATGWATATGYSATARGHAADQR